MAVVLVVMVASLGVVQECVTEMLGGQVVVVRPAVIILLRVAHRLLPAVGWEVKVVTRRSLVPVVALVVEVPAAKAEALQVMTVE